LLATLRSGRSRTGRIIRLLGLALLSVLFMQLLSGLEFMREVELRSLDLMFRISPSPEEADTRVILVLLDGGSMDQLPWPVPRQFYAAALDLLQDWGIKAAGFDILFDTPSTYSVQDDSLLGTAASAGRTVFVMSLLQRDGLIIPQTGMLQVEATGSDLDSAWTCIPPYTDIAYGASALSSTNERQDSDGVYRSVRLLTAVPGGFSPSLPLSLAWLALDSPALHLDETTLRIGDIRIPLQPGGRMQLRFHGPTGTYTSIPLADIAAALNARAMGQPCPVDSTIFRNSVVLFGYAAPALYDLKPTPYSPSCPGVEVLATAVDNILNGSPLSILSAFNVMLVALAVSMLSAYLLGFSGKILLGAALAVLPPAIFALLSVIIFRNGLWIATALPIISALLTILAGGLFLFGSENRRKREVRSAFSQYLSPEVVSQVIEHPEMLVLGGTDRVMTSFFSDIRGFTGISEQISPTELVSILNMYLTRMTDLILATGGTVDKFEGDAIIAFWGAPIEFEDHASRACSTALACQKAHAPLNRELTRKGFPELVTRIGLSTGHMVVGNMGSSSRFDYTIMGSTVNLGSRLEGANKVYGTSIMVPASTAESAGDRFVFRELDTVRVIGQKTPVTVYELICHIEDSTPELEELLRTYAEALVCYRKRDFIGAAELFESLEDDPPSSTMARRCRIFQNSTEPEDDGSPLVYDLTSK